MYGPYPGSVAGNITSTMTDTTGRYVYGVNLSGSVGGEVSSTLTRVTAKEYLYGINGNSTAPATKDVTVTMNDCTSKCMYAVSSIPILGDLVVDINGGTFGSATEYTYTYFVSCACVKGTSTVTVSDVTTNGNVYPYQLYSSGYDTYGESGDATVTVENTTFGNGNGTCSFYNAPGQDQKVTMTLDENSEIGDDFSISASGSYGEGTISYKDDIYYGGNITFEEDTTMKNVHLSGGCFYIPKGVTLTCDKFYFDNGTLLLEGTLDATLAGELNDSGKYPGSYVYVMGGSMTGDLNTISNLYYPFELNYKEKGGKVTLYNQYSYKPVTHPMVKDKLFGLVGGEIKYNVSASEGYTLASVTYTADGETTNVPSSGTTYTLTMPSAECSLDIDFQGNQIVVGKTVADPVLKLNVETTEDAPAYDFSTLAISNDGAKGEVTYKVDSTYTLPEGLSLKDGKIIGTPTVAYESGKKSIIHVTGKNDTSVEVSLNIIVTEGDAKQDNQDGRITVDDTNLMIYMSGNSVVIETEDNQTALYLDDDRDGVADYETPAYVGDLTNYTLYGLRNADSTKPIRITVNGGTIGSVYGAYNGKITYAGHGLEVYVNGGSVGTLYGLSDATVSGTMKFVVATDATVTGFTASSSYTAYTG